MEPQTITEGVQADLPEPPEGQEQTLKIRPLERVRIMPHMPSDRPVPPGSAQKFYSHKWILEDGREVPDSGSITKASYKMPELVDKNIDKGVRKRMMTTFFWEEMLAETIEEVAATGEVADYCTEYESNYVKEGFEPHDLGQEIDAEAVVKYPLHATGFQTVTFHTWFYQKCDVAPKGPILDRFKKNPFFSKPIYERMNDVMDLDLMPKF